MSSLVHSSTLVTAGVYVLIRYHYLFFLFSWFFKVFSLFTMFIAGACACVEKDFKKVIAISTLSQLGMMLFVLSVGLWVLSFLHMVIHAFFKRMLFLSSGSLIGQNWGAQDSRFYGGLPFGRGSVLFFFVSCFSLSGFPFVIGFYSKDFIISRVLGNNGGVFFFIFVLCCFLTVFYRIRLFVSGFLSFYKSAPHLALSERGLFLFPVYFLFFICCFCGGGLAWFFLRDVSFFFRGFDLFVGLLVIIVCLLFYSPLVFRYNLFSFLMNIGFLRWISGGGVSRSFSSMFFYSGESS